MLRNSILVVVSLIVGFLMIEGGLRLFLRVPSPYPYSSPLLVKDKRGVWVLDPGTETIMDNAADFRGKRVHVDNDGTRHVPCHEGSDRRIDRPRLIIVGDSQTFGHGLDDAETWPNRLQCLLNAGPAPPWVINVGVPATNGDQYLMKMSYLLPSLRRGDRILVVFTWNDLTADIGNFNVDSASIQRCPGKRDAESHSPVLAPCLVTPKEYYQSKMTWRRRLFETTGIFVPSFNSLHAFLQTATFSSAAAFVALPKLKLIYYRFRPGMGITHDSTTDHVVTNMRIAARIRDLAQARGAEVAILLLPNRVFYDDVYYQAYSKAGAAFPEQDFPMHVAAPHCRNLNLTCLSLFDALRTDSMDRYNFAFDGHLNPAGAEAVARQIFRWLTTGPLKR